MLRTLSTYFVRTLREDPVDAEVVSHKLLVRAGYIRRAAPGIYTWLPLGVRVLHKVEAIVRDELDRIGAQEVHFPALLPAEPYQRSGRWSEYGPDLFRLKDRREADYLLAPTHEEMFTLLVKDVYSSYKDLPVVLYQIQTKYRDEARPRAGLLRGREFVMEDAYSFDVEDAGLDRAYDQQRAAYIRILDRLGVPYVICSAFAGPMGGSRSEEFLTPSPIGEDTFVMSPGGYAANAEAVRTVAPAPRPIEGLPPARVHETPDSPTIASLVQRANALHPRADRPWRASDTLKNVVLAATGPDGKRRLVAIGVPGDRDVDPKRVEAALYPAAVEMASAQDLAAHPELVAGYIGPDALGPNAHAHGVRYLLDPRVVNGTAWITGANEPGRHVFGLVKGRDFEADGWIEAAQVLDGDPAPDGSGPLRVRRGMELAHIFQLGRKYSKALGLAVLGRDGTPSVVTMGSYGLGISRLIAALAEADHDERGLIWPASVAPFDVHVVATGKDRALTARALEVARALEAAGLDVLYDDRPRASAGVKFKDAELLGMPITVIVGRGLARGVVELRVRASGESAQVPLDAAVSAVVQRHRALLGAGAPVLEHGRGGERVEDPDGEA